MLTTSRRRHCIALLLLAGCETAPAVDAGADVAVLDTAGLDTAGLDAPGLDAPGLDAPGTDAPAMPRDAPRRDAGPAMASPRLVALAPGEVLDMGPIDCESPVGDEGGCRAVTDFGGMAYDPIGHRMLVWGGGHAGTMTDSIQALDLSGELDWRDLYSPSPCSIMTEANLDRGLGAWRSGASGPYPRPATAHSYDLLGYAPVEDEFVVLGRAFTDGAGDCGLADNAIGGPTAHYSDSLGSWEFGEDASSTLSTDLAGTERDPVSGDFVVLGSDGLRIYDPASRTIVHRTDVLRRADGEWVGDMDVTFHYANHLVYYPPTDRFYYFVRSGAAASGVLEIVPDRADWSRTTVALLTTTGSMSPHEEPGYDYDAQYEVIRGGVSDGVLYTFDPRARSWRSSVIPGIAEVSQAYHALGYDPVSEVFIFRGYSLSGGYRTYAYRPAD